ncbi:hypothetical protein RA307_31790, partial [Xanthobacteraceae bacterium Astr-EGSB]|uniref:hypothetical protein n=1 Tax=Astrobacterium formosum TaxID=3069710 RepID=UPI0027B0C576|nr:hypothetical protein [Xanthobacteraceae bacterium Astr-EGSB]
GGLGSKLSIPIALVTEARVREDSEPSKHSRDLDMTTPDQAECIRRILERVADEVVIFNDLTQFASAASSLNDWIIWPHWNGARNRNRTAQVAMICEVHSLRYVGPDPYARLIANDKSLTKHFLRQAGLLTPDSIFIATPEQLSLIESLTPPFIIKPNMEGSSIGIDAHSIAFTSQDAKSLALAALRNFPEGVIAEQFVEGPEVFIAVSFDRHNRYRCGATERIVKDEPDFLHRDVYDYSLKFSDAREVILRSSDILTDGLLKNIIRMTETLQTIDLIRVDGRLRNGEFCVIEITPDPLMTPDSEFLGSLLLAGHETDDILRDIIERVAAKTPSLQSSNLGK